MTTMKELNYRLIRFIYISMGASAVMLYATLCVMVGSNWKEELYSQETIWLKIYFLLNWLVFVPGFGLVIAAAYVFIYKKDLCVNTIGIIVLACLVIVHFFVESVAAHSAPTSAFIYQMSELIIIVSGIVMYQRYSMSSGLGSDQAE